MKSFQLLPAIDLLDSKPVRLLRGDFAQKTEYSDKFSLEFLATTFSEFASGIHVVDLDGAKKGETVNFEAIQTILRYAQVPVEVGGGIRTLATAEKLFALGVSRIILGTSALENPDFLRALLAQFEEGKVVVGVDANNGFVATHGWENSSEILANDFFRQLEKNGVRTVIFTDIATDGSLVGSPIETFSALVRAFPNLEIIASGGVASITDIEALRKVGVAGAVFGKSFYEGRISVEELKNFSLEPC